MRIQHTGSGSLRFSESVAPFSTRLVMRNGVLTLLLLLQVSHGKSPMRCHGVAVGHGVDCGRICQCGPFPPVPPPPPPPPPPRHVLLTVVPPAGPTGKSWWKEVVGISSSTSFILLLLTVLVCYKAMKRKPSRKEENGTSQGDFSSSSPHLTAVEI